MPDKELTEYWKKKYKDLPIDYSQAEGKDVNINWMKARRLKYGGEDGGGHFWVDHCGRKYYFQDLPRKGEREPQNDVNVTQTEYPIGTVPEVPDYTSFAAQSGAYASGLNESFMQELRKSKDDVLSSKHDVLGSWADVLKNDVTEDVLGTKSANVQRADADEKAACSRHSYLYIVDEKTNMSDLDGKRFFMYLNERCGNIFSICPDGKVLLIEGKSPDTVQISYQTSRILAKTVYSAILGGVGYNHSLTKHKIKLVVFDPSRPQESNPQKNNSIYFDDYTSRMVDLSDYSEVLRRINPNEYDYPNEIIQAAYMGHFICELSAQPHVFRWAHHFGVKRECEILIEMLNLNGKTQRLNETVEWVNRNVQFVKNRYPLANNKTLIIKIYVNNVYGGDNKYAEVWESGSLSHEEKWKLAPLNRFGGIVKGANIYISKNTKA